MAAGRDIRGITVTIGGDTTKLQESLSAVNKTIKTTQSQLANSITSSMTAVQTACTAAWTKIAQSTTLSATQVTTAVTQAWAASSAGNQKEHESGNGTSFCF